jgi:hypothetical protein
LNVNSFDTNLNTIKDDTWLMLKQLNTSLRVGVNFLVLDEAIRKYSQVLTPSMPLQTLRYLILFKKIPLKDSIKFIIQFF